MFWGWQPLAFTVRSIFPWGRKVSWQVTGVRKDPWAEANRIVVEENKPDTERGRYLHPELYGVPREEGIGRPAEPARMVAPAR